MAYFQDIKDGIQTTLKGLSITMRHLRQATESRKPLSVSSDNYFEQQTGLVTVQYPHEQLPIPDNGRYRLHNEIDDCIVCDKCAKVCPVDCITIDAIKATEEIGKASDGSPIRLYAATFDIDMAKCCYCGLCTVVCPTECLTMEKKFDYSEFDLGKLTYGFANLTADEAEEKRMLYEQFVQEKAALKAQQIAKPAAPVQAEAASTAPKAGRPVFRPTAKPKTEVTQVADVPPIEVDRGAAEASPAVVTSGTDPVTQEEHTVQPTEPVTSKPKGLPFKPSMKPAVANVDPVESQPSVAPLEDKAKAKPAFRPTMKPPVAKVAPAEQVEAIEKAEPPSEETPKPRPAFRPTMKPPVKKEPTAEHIEPPESEGSTTTETPKPKPSVPFRPTMKPKNP